MVKTIEYSAGITTVDFSEAHPYGASNRYYAVRNYGDSDIYISASDTCAEGFDGTKRVPAGECRGIDMQGLNVLYISAQGAGTAEIDTAAGISALGFNGGSKGGGSSGGVVTACGNPVQLDGLQGGVPFNSVVVSGKNLIGIAQGKALMGDDTNGYLVSNNATSRTIIQKLQPNTTYTIKKYDDGNRFRIVMFSDEPTVNADITAEQLINNSDGSVSEYTLTTGIDHLWLALTTHYATSGDAVEPIVQLELGDTPTEYEPPITGRELTVNVNGTDYTITPDSNPYTVPVDIIQQDGLNVLSIADDSNPTISVSGNKASEQLGMIFRTLDNKPVMLFDGTIPTSSSAGYAEFTIDKECSMLLIAPVCNSSNVYSMGYCIAIPLNYIEEEEKAFSVDAFTQTSSSSSKAYIKRNGDTIYVRESSTTCDHMTIYGI